MFFQAQSEYSKFYHAIVSAHIYVDEKGVKDIEILDFVESEDEGLEIFEDIDYTLLELVDIGGKEQHYFMAHVKARYHTYNDYFDGVQGDVESEVTELKSIRDFSELELEDIQTLNG